jgi:hypothetical protein
MNTRLNRFLAQNRRGKVVVLVAFLLPTVLVPILAIGVDGGLLMEDRRRLQAASDAAALAAAAQLYRDNAEFISNNSDTLHPPNTSGAIAAAYDTLNQHGFESEDCEIRTITLPAASSNPRINGKPGTIEVKVTFLQPRGFSGLWGTEKLKVATRSVSRVRNFSFGNGIILLEETDRDGLRSRGGGALLVNRGGVYVNSESDLAAETEGTGSVLAAKNFDVVGGTLGDGFYKMPYPGAGGATPLTGTFPTPDPYRNMPEPSPTSFDVQKDPPHVGKSGVPIVLQPGRYTKRLDFSGGDTQVILSPGTYYLEAGISLTGDARLTGVGVTLYNIGSGNNGGIDFSGQGQWSITAPTSGPYEGVAFYQSRYTASETTTMNLSGNGGGGLIGLVYAPTTQVKLSGNGTQTIGSQFIARTLEMTGNGTFLVDFAAPKPPQPPIIELVE